MYNADLPGCSHTSVAMSRAANLKKDNTEEGRTNIANQRHITRKNTNFRTQVVCSRWK